MNPWLISIGPVLQFLPLDPAKRHITEKISFERTKGFLHKHYKVIPSENSLSEVTATKIDEEVLRIYSDIVSYYLAYNNTDSAKVILGKLLRTYNNTLPLVVNQSDIPQMLLLTEYVREGKKVLEDYAIFIYKLHQHSSALYGFMTKERTLYLLKRIQGLFNRYDIETAKIDEIIEKLDN